MCIRDRFLSPKQVKEIWPLCHTDDLVGAIQHPEDGYIQPADLTQAMATGARNMGAEIYRNTTVLSMKQTKDGWVVETDKGSIECEHIISCSGNFARQTGEMVGLDIPVIPVEHQYIVTEPHPEIQKRKKDGLPEMGVLRDSDSRWYMREEAGGLILGPYEDGAPACYVEGPSKNSEYELFQEDLDRLAPHIEGAIHRVPAFGEVGVKKVYNGAICYTPDGNPIVGPAWGLKNFWINEGHSFGITAAGGAGWQLAEWIVDGEPTIDMLGVEPRRYGNYATKSYLKAKNEEAYSHVFIVHYPDEERPAARPLRTSPCYERMKNLGAVFGQKFGWERPNFFATDGMEQKDHWSFRRSKWFDAIKKECENVKKNVGLLDMTAFAKCRIKGPKARELMQRVSKDDFSNENFKWLSAKMVDIGYAPVNAMRVNFVGELGWELHHPIEYQNHIFDKLMEAGQDLGIKPYGIRAMNSLRVEKSYKLVGTELSIEYSPYESGLDRFVHPNKGKFIGLEALNQWREKGFNNKLITMEVHNTTDADVLGNNPVYENGSVIGRATGGDFGFRLDKSIALAMVKPELGNVGQKLKIDILGKMHEATVLEESPYDPENNLLRA